MLIFMNFLISFNLMRNCLAIEVSLWAIYYLRKKKRIRFWIFSICAFLIHYTASIIFILYLYEIFFKDRLFNDKKIIFLITISLAIISIIIYPSVLNLFYNSGYTSYLEKEYSLIGHIPKIILLILVYCTYNDIIENLKKSEKLIYLKSFMLFMAILPISILIGGISRIQLFFEFPTIILWGEIIDISMKKVKYGEKQMDKCILAMAYVILTLWILFRIYRIGFAYGIMPYYSDLF